MGRATTNMVYEPYKELHRARPDGSSDASHNAATAGRMASAAAKSFGRFNAALFKGAVVDLPLAAAEGFRAVPALYGEQITDHGAVTDVATGFSKAGRNFAFGMADGFADLFVRPVQDAQRDGARGLAKGLGKGVLGFAAKTASATVGIVAYPGEGICKSLRHAAHSGTRRGVRARKVGEGVFLAGRAQREGWGGGVGGVEGVVRAFELLASDKGRVRMGA